MPTIPQPVRAWIYRILTPVSALLIAYGVADEKTVTLWIALATSVLGFGLAAVNTPTKPEQ